MRSRGSASRLLISALLAALAAPAAADECVVLLHGLWRTDASMDKMERNLDEAGYAVRNIAYDSTDSTVETLAAETIPRAVDACGEAGAIGGKLMGGPESEELRNEIKTLIEDSTGKVKTGSELVNETGQALGRHLDGCRIGFDLGASDRKAAAAALPGWRPDLWTQEVFERMRAMLRKGGLLVTYCAKGEVRRRMQRAGFETERLEGPPGKREMLRGGV